MTHADGTATTAAARPETAWPLENLLFSAALVARRIPWADLPARTLGLDALTRDGLTDRLMAHLRNSRAGRPVPLRTPFGSFLVPLTRADAQTLLTCGDAAGALGAPCALTADGRRRGLSPHATPPGATEIGAGVWEATARGGPGGLGGLGDQVAEHLVTLAGAVREDGTPDRDRWEAGMRRLSRHVVLGAAATEDTLLSAMLSTAADAAGGHAYEARAAALRRRMAPYLADLDPDCLAGRLAAEGQSGADPHPALVPALAHALALVSAATGPSTLKALTLLTTDANTAAAAAADACGTRAGVTGTAPPTEEAIDHAMDRALEQHRMLSALVYPVRAPFAAQGLAIGAGEEILYDAALLGPRSPGEPADPAWALCGNPSGCPAARFAADVGREVLRQVTTRNGGTSGIGGQVAGGGRAVLPGARFAVDPVPDAADSRTVAMTMVTAMTAPLAAYGARGLADADRLEGHAESLCACAADTGWNGSETGERFRMALLAHAERCTRAADDVRRAARWLAD
ncbi:hypothetical protein ACFYZ4_09370 [Streptomyces sp. NPDC001513]|uniref:hypothetical protein n=1 Tax=Streptomyces sp. NPDC001513 TaxID=3364580 RepID=UPI0036B262B2